MDLRFELERKLFGMFTNKIRHGSRFQSSLQIRLEWLRINLKRKFHNSFVILQTIHVNKSNGSFE